MKKWMIGIGLLALVLGGLFLVGYIDIPGKDLNANVGVSFYDADGNEVNVPMAYMRGGTPVTDLGLRVSWSWTGEDLVLDTLAVYGYAYLYLMEEVDGNYIVSETLVEVLYSPTNPEVTRFIQWLYPLSDLLPDGDSWYIQAKTTINANVEDTFGNTLRDTIDVESSVFLINWEAVTGTFEIGGSIVA